MKRTADETRDPDISLKRPPKKSRRGFSDETVPSKRTFESRGDEDDLLPLLDFTQLDTQSAVSSRFSAIAQALIHQYRIEITTSTKVEQLELLEIEFYLYKSGCHEDPFTHASAEQSQAGRWCVHLFLYTDCVWMTLTIGTSTGHLHDQTDWTPRLRLLRDTEEAHARASISRSDSLRPP